MANVNENIAELLIKKKIKPSFHRIKVMEYLMDHQNHPTVEQIFTKLKQEFPTLSKVTIYNSLSLFVEANLARAITIEGNEIRYDLILENHGHFKCESCGAILDFKINIDKFVSGELEDFVINDKNVYFKGICSRCLLKNKEKN